MICLQLGQAGQCCTQTLSKLEVLKIEFSAASGDDAELDLTVMSTDLHI